ncbi:hypothetical protein Mal64_20960 [Pseudobythopirellula maris]|uniref:Glycosyl hydrolases family 2, sugar binding domain n=1 Tax=Pseudobythopirellula maris TaxID=2527991 RepID=A0A5C5ZPA6_9BACT|nr:glycosyl hydrolase [Pseudobythopirellula maris]TWT88611.1 hypothetical protein Mal64_20960 [Pseudobythopirellula maris]
MTRAFLALIVSAMLVAAAQAAEPTWPEPTAESKPWSRWWWHGSAVDEANLTRLLEEYDASGLGGVEITCLYGVNGEDESREIDYESDRWVEVVTHALDEAERLGMIVDLPPGSGWRMGGPSVAREDGNAEVYVLTDEVSSGKAFEKDYSQATPKRGLPPQAVVAYGADGKTIDLTDRLSDEGVLEWTVPAGGSWRVAAVGMRLSGERVKRAGPGGSGLNINPYSRRSVENFLAAFGESVDKLPEGKIRASFHDSYEYNGSWSDDFLQEFQERRGYPLEQHLLELSGESDDLDAVARVRCDYRETMSDLVRDALIKPWIEWSHSKGQLARNQAHGSPGNWLDLYAMADIPETESFGRLEGGDGRPALFRFASSAAHLAGRRLVSSETATWLAEHFTVDLGQVKEIVDRQLISGINHIIYHGTAYSPEDASWPGWVFYASTQLNPQNPLWRDFPALNKYVGRCQSLLQAGEPDNDLLVYWPVHDAWSTGAENAHAGNLRMPLTVHNAHVWLFKKPIGKASEWLDANGYAYDFVSDALLEGCRAEEGEIVAAGGSYQAVLVPHAELMPTATLNKLAKLSAAGCKVLFLEAKPTSPPGFMPTGEQEVFDAVLAKLSDAPTSADLASLLGDAGVRREPFVAGSGLQFVRRELADGPCYFLANQGEEAFDGAIELSSPCESAVLMDPVTGEIGAAKIASGQVAVQLEPGETAFVRPGAACDEDWVYRDAEQAPEPIDGEWRVEFAAGGPALPDSYTTATLDSWTGQGGDAERFAGTAAYTTTFDAPAGEETFDLDLGEVADSARLVLNGEDLGVRFASPFRWRVAGLKPTGNELRVEVTNVASNRVRDLDRRGVEWRIFKDINFVTINYKPFDASDWPVRDAGLLGPVTLTPIGQ